MTTPPTSTATRQQAPAPMRARLVDAASELFYAEGLRATTVDRIVERAATTKVTFYRHFPSKDDLVIAYLEVRAGQERDAITAAIDHAGGDAAQVFALIAGALGEMACDDSFRGCPFINAAAEYPDATSPVRVLIDSHRAWWHEAFERIVAPLDLPDPVGTADDLMLLRDGSMVAGYLDDEGAVRASFLRSSRLLTGLR